jgi:hypothetical protein
MNYTSAVANDRAEQLQLRAKARKAIGKIAGRNPMPAELARILIRERLARKGRRSAE